MFQLAIRDAKNNVTALMTNLTGANLTFKDLGIDSEKDMKKEA